MFRYCVVVSLILLHGQPVSADDVKHLKPQVIVKLRVIERSARAADKGRDRWVAEPTLAVGVGSSAKFYAGAETTIPLLPGEGYEDLVFGTQVEIKAQRLNDGKLRAQVCIATTQAPERDANDHLVNRGNTQQLSGVFKLGKTYRSAELESSAGIVTVEITFTEDVPNKVER